MSRRTARIIAIVLALIMAATLVFGVISSLTADARVTVTQAQIDWLREERRDIQIRRQEVQSRINEIEFEKLSELSKKAVLDDRIILVGYEIENISETIDDYEFLIEENEREVLTAIENEDIHLKLYRERVRSMEENGVISYLEIIFNAKSFTDLLARLDFVSDIMKADITKYNNLADSRIATESAKESLERAKKELEDERDQLRIKQEEILVLLDEASAIIRSLQNNIETESDLDRQIALDEERVQRQIAESLEQLRRQEAAARIRGISGTGRLIWPVPSSAAVISEFGTRRHPDFGVIRQHNGVDIRAGHGSDVIASDSGTVITSTFNSTYGHFIVISHGSGTTTLYAHLSTRRVSPGTAVTQGQVIGLIGSTGVSTGAHLHFEVAVNGSRQDPMRHFNR